MSFAKIYKCRECRHQFDGPYEDGTDCPHCGYNMTMCSLCIFHQIDKCYLVGCNNGSHYVYEDATIPTHMVQCYSCDHEYESDITISECPECGDMNYPCTICSRYDEDEGGCRSFHDCDGANMWSPVHTAWEALMELATEGCSKFSPKQIHKPGLVKCVYIPVPGVPTAISGIAHPPSAQVLVVDKDLPGEWHLVTWEQHNMAWQRRDGTLIAPGRVDFYVTLPNPTEVNDDYIKNNVV